MKGLVLTLLSLLVSSKMDYFHAIHKLLENAYENFKTKRLTCFYQRKT